MSFYIHNLRIWHPFNCCKCTVFKIGINHKTRNCVLHCFPLASLQTKITDFPIPIHLLQLVKSLHKTEVLKRNLFQAEPSRTGHYGGDTLPPGYQAHRHLERNLNTYRTRGNNIIMLCMLNIYACVLFAR